MKRSLQLFCLGVAAIVVVLHVITLATSRPVTWNVSTVHLSLTLAFVNQARQLQSTKYDDDVQYNVKWNLKDKHEISHIETRNQIFSRELNGKDLSMNTTWLLDYLARIANISVSPKLEDRDKNRDYRNNNTRMYEIDMDHRQLGSGVSVCPKGVFLAIFISSSVDHFRYREAIRHTWAASPPDGASVFFVVGQTKNGTLQGWLEEERRKHRDVISVQVIDTYANLTLKALEILKWTLDECPEAKYILKADDDTFVNIHNLVKDLNHVTHHNFIMGDVIAGAQPMRDPKSKWYTPVEDYPGAMYPDYVSGSAYVISGDLIPKLYAACRKMSVFWIEDVFITGSCAKQSNATLVHNGKFKRNVSVRSSSFSTKLQRYIALHRIAPEVLTEMWKR